MEARTFNPIESGNRAYESEHACQGCGQNRRYVSNDLCVFCIVPKSKGGKTRGEFIAKRNRIEAQRELEKIEREHRYGYYDF